MSESKNMEKRKKIKNLTLKHFEGATKAIIDELYTPIAFRKYAEQEQKENQKKEKKARKKPNK